MKWLDIVLGAIAALILIVAQILDQKMPYYATQQDADSAFAERHSNVSQ